MLSNPIAGCMRWGTWGANYNSKQVADVITNCVEAGITSFDHADIYGHYTTEALFGEALKHLPGIRKQLQLITKCGIQMISDNRPNHKIRTYNTTAAHIIQSVENSLQYLNTDYLDVLLIHRPSPLLKPTEVAEAVCQLKQSGKILAFGVSNFTPMQMEALSTYCEISYNQLEVSLMHIQAIQDGTLDYCMAKRIQTMAWSPLGGNPSSIKNPDLQEALQQIANKYETDIATIMFAWLNKLPSAIIPVTGSSVADRIIAAKNAQLVDLNNDEWFILWKAATGNEIP
ncbi:MAG: aldo/keto reductase [Chitinophagaceae bacterium]